MRLAVQFGTDTGMALADVYLETAEEAALDAEDIWDALRPLLAAQGYSPADVVDFFLHKKDADGNWVSAGKL